MTERLFSQADVNEIVESRLAAQRRRIERAHADQLADLQQRYAQRIADLEAEQAEQAERVQPQPHRQPLRARLRRWITREHIT
jgi:phage host-nuclease inhibitor protein Gam